MTRSILITAGATRNPIDSMRVITANSSGATGVWLGHQFQELGLDVHLLGSNLARLLPDCPSQNQEFGSTRDLMAKMEEWCLAHPNGIVIHAAAVGDFELVNAAQGKISSGQTLTLELSPTPKIVDAIKQWSSQIHLISFKAAAPDTTDSDLFTIAAKQCTRTQSDLVFANVLTRIEDNILLYAPKQQQWFAKRTDALDALVSYVLNL